MKNIISYSLLLLFTVVFFQNCGSIDSSKSPSTQSDQPTDQSNDQPTDSSGESFLRSTASSPYLIILESDPSSFTCLENKGIARREFPRESCNNDSCLFADVQLFLAHFNDGTSVELQMDPAYQDVTKARELALKVAKPLGQIPTLLRKDIDRGLISKGEGGAYSDIGAFFIASDYIDKRVEEKKLAHTLFHESIHAVFEDNQKLHETAEWKAAQTNDGQFISDYARKNPDREDMAETALLAYAIQYKPGRIPTADENTIKRLIPNRLSYLSKILPTQGEEIFYSVGPQFPCPPE